MSPRPYATLLLGAWLACSCKHTAGSLIRGIPTSGTPQRKAEKAKGEGKSTPLPKELAKYLLELLLEDFIDQDVLVDEPLDQPSEEVLVCIEQSIIAHMPGIAVQYLESQLALAVLDGWGEVEQVQYVAAGSEVEEVTITMTEDGEEEIKVSKKWKEKKKPHDSEEEMLSVPATEPPTEPPTEESAEGEAPATETPTSSPTAAPTETPSESPSQAPSGTPGDQPSEALDEYLKEMGVQEEGKKKGSDSDAENAERKQDTLDDEKDGNKDRSDDEKDGKQTRRVLPELLLVERSLQGGDGTNRKLQTRKRRWSGVFATRVRCSLMDPDNSDSARARRAVEATGEQPAPPEGFLSWMSTFLALKMKEDCKIQQSLQMNFWLQK